MSNQFEKLILVHTPLIKGDPFKQILDEWQQDNWNKQLCKLLAGSGVPAMNIMSVEDGGYRQGFLDNYVAICKSALAHVFYIDNQDRGQDNTAKAVMELYDHPDQAAVIIPTQIVRPRRKVVGRDDNKDAFFYMSSEPTGAELSHLYSLLKSRFPSGHIFESVPSAAAQIAQAYNAKPSPIATLLVQGHQATTSEKSVAPSWWRSLFSRKKKE
jgi:hypothetical protein